jgi:hypothetical protein
MRNRMFELVPVNDRNGTIQANRIQKSDAGCPNYAMPRREKHVTFVPSIPGHYGNAYRWEWGESSAHTADLLLAAACANLPGI